MKRTSVGPCSRQPKFNPMSKTAPVDTAESLESLHLQSMCQALSAMLDRVPGSRRALPHLAALELSLKRNGLDSVKQASVPVLHKVLAQLDGMPDLRREPALQSLQAALLSAIVRQQPTHPNAELKSLGDSRSVVEVRELTHSTFMAMAGGQATMPARFPETQVLTRPAPLAPH
jgi:hypothetical protein